MKKSASATALFLCDQHIPFIDEYADELTFAVAKVIQPEVIIFGGDLVDWWSISKFHNNPLDRKDTIQDDIDAVSKYLRRWRREFKKSKLIFLEGNHEHRMRTWKEFHPEVKSLRALDTQNLFGIKEIGIDQYFSYYPSDWLGSSEKKNEYWLVPNKFIVMHGERYSINSGAICNLMIRDYGCSGLSGHNHKIGHSSRTFKREEVNWWEAGCLCKINPSYKQHANWQPGFGVVSVFSTGDVQVYPVSIKQGYQCEVFGKRFDRKGAL